MGIFKFDLGPLLNVKVKVMNSSTANISKMVTDSDKHYYCQHIKSHVAFLLTCLQFDILNVKIKVKVKVKVKITHISTEYL